MEYKETKLYPDLPVASAPEAEILIVEGSAHSYRLVKINEIQKEIQAERDKREHMSKKYHRAVKIIAGVDTALVVSSIGMGAAGIAVLSTIVSAPIAMVMEGTAMVIGFASIIGTHVNKKLSLKAEKHEQIKTLANAKLSTISDHISKALMDNHISDEEYSLILSELNKFNEMKMEIKSKIKVAIDEETKQSLIAKGREDALASFQTMLGKSQKSFKKP